MTYSECLEQVRSNIKDLTKRIDILRALESSIMKMIAERESVKDEVPE